MKQKYLFKQTWFGAWPTRPLGWLIILLSNIVAISVVCAVVLAYDAGAYEFVVLVPLLSFWYSALLWLVYKHEKKHEWFIARKKGFGWHPQTWQGWLVVAIILSLVSVIAISVGYEAQSTEQTLKASLPSLILLALTAHWVCHTTSIGSKWHIKRR